MTDKEILDKIEKKSKEIRKDEYSVLGWYVLKMLKERSEH